MKLRQLAELLEHAGGHDAHGQRRRSRSVTRSRSA